MSRVEDYLAISASYCRSLGGLRWCPGGEAVEYACDGPEIGMTFAMAAEIALFLEGFQTGGQPISFSFVLHLLQLLGLGTRRPEPESLRRVVPLEKAFRESGLPFRNAGALCAMLCQDVPREPGAPALSEICLALNRPSWGSLGDQRMTRRAVMPPLEPAVFEGRFVRALAKLDPQQVRHWLRFGRGPVVEAGDRVAGALPRNLSARVEMLSQRPRMAGAGPLVAQLSGALALPPRRLSASDLPTGGYSDVSTRGRPEQILPGQLALEGDEFVRRFAERELLYFNREEPRAPASEEVVAILDQGVRTWGDVRLVLAAGLVALGRQAARRGAWFHVAATSHRQAPIDPLGLSDEELGAILEASDLSPHPGLLLERVLERPSEVVFRDVVLLSHPRSLLEPEVVAASRRAAGGTRVFAITVDPAGQVELAEIRHGSPVVRSRCRVEVAAPPSVSPSPRRQSLAGPSAWLGDVETPPFPFKLGALSPIPDHLFDFEDSGDWIMFAGHQGVLHAWRTDGSSIEMLPRGLHGGRAVSMVDAIVGVLGGFAVAGRSGGDEVVAHYDFASRTCRVHRLGWARTARREWTYDREHHTIIAHVGNVSVGALDLGASVAQASYSPGTGSGVFSHRAECAFLASQRLGVTDDSEALRLRPDSGEVELVGPSGVRRSVMPMSEGKPALVGSTVRLTKYAGDVAAALIGNKLRASVYFFSRSTFRLLGESPARFDSRGFALSRDGRRFARKAGDRHLEVRGVTPGSAAVAVSPKGKCHQSMEVELGHSFFTVHTGKFTHLVRWDRRIIEFAVGRDGTRPLLLREFAGTTPRRVAATRGGCGALADNRRFVNACSYAGLTLAVDFAGQVSVMGAAREPIVMFYVFRDQIAAWMPDGSCMGPPALTGAPPTPGGPERIATALAAGARAAGSPAP